MNLSSYWWEQTANCRRWSYRVGSQRNRQDSNSSRPQWMFIEPSFFFNLYRAGENVTLCFIFQIRLVGPGAYLIRILLVLLRWHYNISQVQHRIHGSTYYLQLRMIFERWLRVCKCNLPLVCTTYIWQRPPTATVMNYAGRSFLQKNCHKLHVWTNQDKHLVWIAAQDPVWWRLTNCYTTHFHTTFSISHHFSATLF
jgi:hypothetical protein